MAAGPDSGIAANAGVARASQAANRWVLLSRRIGGSRDEGIGRKTTSVLVTLRVTLSLSRSKRSTGCSENVDRLQQLYDAEKHHDGENSADGIKWDGCEPFMA